MRNIVFLIGSFLIIGFASLFYSYFIEPNQLVVNHTQIKVKDWNPAFNGLKIVAISDIHAGSNYIDEDKLRKIVKTANDQNPDLIVLLGDFISQKKGIGTELNMPLETIAENLKGFKAKYGVYGVLGNHDLFHYPARIKSLLNKAGIRMLENELAFIEKDGEKLRVFGAKDHLHVVRWDIFANECKKVLEANEQVGDVLVLEHGPDLLPMISEENMISKDFKLMLSGHTHGGQIRFPLIGSLIVPSSYGQKYARGHVRDRGVDMFVTTGIGTSILPFRFMVPPEIAVLTIIRE